MSATSQPSRPVEQADLEDARRQDAFLRWSVPSDTVLGAWAVGAAIAVVHDRAPRRVLPSPWAVLLGEAADVEVLVDALPIRLGRSPAGVTVTSTSYPVVPKAWDLVVRGEWDYMVTATPPPSPEGVDIVELTEQGAINTVLDAANADAHARPGDPEELCWLGIADDEGLACVGALTLTHNAGAHLRAITTLPRARGRGYGRALSAALTRRGLEEVSPEVTLGVYSDNDLAIRLYERLGFERVHRFVSSAVTQDVRGGRTPPASVDAPVHEVEECG